MSMIFDDALKQRLLGTLPSSDFVEIEGALYLRAKSIAVAQKTVVIEMQNGMVCDVATYGVDILSTIQQGGTLHIAFPDLFLKAKMS